MIMTMRSQTRKGAAAKQISPSVVPSGADPFITNNNIPKGGVDMAISRLRSMRRANQMGSKPRLLMRGRKIGMVTIIIETCSMKVPRIMRMSIIMMRYERGDISRLVTNCTSPLVAPV